VVDSLKALDPNRPIRESGEVAEVLQSNTDPSVRGTARNMKPSPSRWKFLHVGEHYRPIRRSRSRGTGPVVQGAHMAVPPMRTMDTARMGQQPPMNFHDDDGLTVRRLRCIPWQARILWSSAKFGVRDGNRRTRCPPRRDGAGSGAARMPALAIGARGYRRPRCGCHLFSISRHTSV